MRKALERIGETEPWLCPCDASSDEDLDTLERTFGPGPINNVALYLEDGVDPLRFVDDLKRRYADRPLVIRSERSLREEVFSVF